MKAVWFALALPFSGLAFVLEVSSDEASYRNWLKRRGLKLVGAFPFKRGSAQRHRKVAVPSNLHSTRAVCRRPFLTHEN